MPDGLARGLPRRPAPEGGEGFGFDFGTAEFLGSDSSWISLTVDVPSEVDGDDDLIIFTHGNDTNGWKYSGGASQDGSVVTGQVVAQHNSAGWVSTYLDLIRLATGSSWPSVLNHNHQHNTFSSQVCLGFRPGPGFKGIQSAVQRVNQGPTDDPTFTPKTNPGPFPGGICIATTTMKSGGAGPSASVSGTGWTGVGTGGLGTTARYILSTTEIETPPDPGFSSSRSARWATCLAYFR